MADVASMWYGSEIDQLGRLTIASFLQHKHSFTLYTYDLNIVVPNGVIVKDANEILNSSQIYGNNNVWQPFSDLFRYKMLIETDYIWVDMDVVCITDDWHFPHEYVFGLEDIRYNNAILSMPKNSKALKYMYETALNTKPSELNWNIPSGIPIDIGPTLLTKTINEFELNKYGLPEKAFYPINPRETFKFLYPGCLKEVLDKSEGNYAVHLYSSTLNKKWRKNIPEYSFIWLMLQKYKCL